MKRRLISLLLAVAVTLSLLPVMPADAQAETKTPWNGITKTEPAQVEGVYQISSAEELAWFADYVNTLGDADTGLVDEDAVLTEDIDLGNQSWTPIGLTAYIVDAYAGTFDGQNHTVSGLKMNATAANYGLFAMVNTGTVKNLKVEGSVESNNVVGGIIGKLQTGTVENCSMSGSVVSTGKTNKGYAGGIIGTIAAKDAVVKGCCNTASVSGTYAGGILGYNKNAAVISHCYNTGEITGSTRSAGIAGQQSGGSISYCYSIGKSTNGISGFSNATVTNCYYLAENTTDETSAPGGTATGYEVITDKEALLINLNAGNEILFHGDEKNSNAGYPVLGWQLISSVLSVPVTSVNILGNVITGATLNAQAKGEGDQTATNVKYQWAVSADKEIFTNLENENSSTFTIPDEMEYVNQYIRLTAVGEEESEASFIVGPIAKSDALMEKENQEKVQEAKASLSLHTTVIKEAATLDLPKEFKGCSIQWTSSNPDIISDTGVVMLPEKDIVSVTLTADITCGTKTDTKEFVVDVWSANVDASVYLRKVLDSMEWNFKSLMPVFGEDTNILVKFKNILNEKGFDGVAVTVQSTEDENLISRNGKIYYPAIPEGGSFANGRQVQVFFCLTVGDESATYPTTNTYSLLVPWDTSDIGKILNDSADAVLTEEALCGDNENLSSVVSDLTLPSCMDGDKYSFGQITWKSSDESHLAISDENRKSGADSLYNPYVGKVYQDGEQHTVTLTATVKNPSTDITVEKKFDIIIQALSEEDLNQTLDGMEKILDCYTPDKLTDFSTKEKLDTASVKNDIQLVIPKNVVTAQELAALDYGRYWDYWNYKFTVTSSDTDVIEINRFRANVYRPLGEDNSSDRQVTLNVSMASKNNPNLSVSKEIVVTVKHLSRVEINKALALMDQAKTNYAAGLLGNNTDVYSVIDNLTPYKEIVWNAGKTGVEFIYKNADRKNDGIFVDELPGWEEQEDWRLFRTSNRELLSNETLILNETPEEDTFVKINSVLTDANFGKYYIKFQNDKEYDAEALIKFKQLYKQPVSAYIMAVGAGNYTADFSVMTTKQKEAFYQSSLSAYKNELDQPIEVSFTLIGAEGTEIISKTKESSFTKGATVFDVFKKVLADNQIAYTAEGSYIKSINGVSEFDYGDRSGWMYTVGNVLVNSYMNAQELSGGEEIVVQYVKDYTLANKPQQEPDKKPDGEKDDPDDSKVDDGNQNDNPVNNQNPGKIPDSGQNNVQNNNLEDQGNPVEKPVGTEKKKVIKILKLTGYKKGTKKISGKTLKGSKVVIRIGKRKYLKIAGKKGNFTVKVSKKLKHNTKIKVTVSKKGYKSKTKIYRVK